MKSEQKSNKVDIDFTSSALSKSLQKSDITTDAKTHHSSSASPYSLTSTLSKAKMSSNIMENERSNSTALITTHQENKKCNEVGRAQKTSHYIEFIDDGKLFEGHLTLQSRNLKTIVQYLIDRQEEQRVIIDDLQQQMHSMRTRAARANRRTNILFAQSSYNNRNNAKSGHVGSDGESPSTLGVTHFDNSDAIMRGDNELSNHLMNKLQSMEQFMQLWGVNVTDMKELTESYGESTLTPEAYTAYLLSLPLFRTLRREVHTLHSSGTRAMQANLKEMNTTLGNAERRQRLMSFTSSSPSSAARLARRVNSPFHVQDNTENEQENVTSAGEARNVQQSTSSGNTNVLPSHPTSSSLGANQQQDSALHSSRNYNSSRSTTKSKNKQVPSSSSLLESGVDVNDVNNIHGKEVEMIDSSAHERIDELVEYIQTKMQEMESKLTLSSLSLSMRNAKNAPGAIANPREMTTSTTGSNSRSKKKGSNTTEKTTTTNDNSSSKTEKRKQETGLTKTPRKGSSSGKARNETKTELKEDTFAMNEMQMSNESVDTIARNDANAALEMLDELAENVDKKLKELSAGLTNLNGRLSSLAQRQVATSSSSSSSTINPMRNAKNDDDNYDLADNKYNDNSEDKRELSLSARQKAGSEANKRQKKHNTSNKHNISNNKNTNVTSVNNDNVSNEIQSSNTPTSLTPSNASFTELELYSRQMNMPLVNPEDKEAREGLHMIQEHLSDVEEDINQRFKTFEERLRVLSRTAIGINSTPQYTAAQTVLTGQPSAVDRKARQDASLSLMRLQHLERELNSLRREWGQHRDRTVTSTSTATNKPKWAIQSFPLATSQPSQESKNVELVPINGSSAVSSTNDVSPLPSMVLNSSQNYNQLLKDQYESKVQHLEQEVAERMAEVNQAMALLRQNEFDITPTERNVQFSNKQEPSDHFTNFTSTPSLSSSSSTSTSTSKPKAAGKAANVNELLINAEQGVIMNSDETPVTAMQNASSQLQLTSTEADMPEQMVERVLNNNHMHKQPEHATIDQLWQTHNNSTKQITNPVYLSQHEELLLLHRRLRSPDAPSFGTDLVIQLPVNAIEKEEEERSANVNLGSNADRNSTNYSDDYFDENNKNDNNKYKSIQEQQSLSSKQPGYHKLAAKATNTVRV